jgi:hypothetical protein
MIDGRKCWFEGDELRPKSELTWAVDPERQTKERARPAPLPPPDPPPPVIEETKDSRPEQQCHPSNACRDRPRTTDSVSPKMPLSGATLQDESVSRPIVPPLPPHILRVQVVHEGMENLSNWIDGKGRPIDLMRGGELQGAGGLGGRLVIPPYYNRAARMFNELEK